MTNVRTYSGYFGLNGSGSVARIFCLSRPTPTESIFDTKNGKNREILKKRKNFKLRGLGARKRTKKKLPLSVGIELARQRLQLCSLSLTDPTIRSADMSKKPKFSAKPLVGNRPIWNQGPEQKVSALGGDRTRRPYLPSLHHKSQKKFNLVTSNRSVNFSNFFRKILIFDRLFGTRVQQKALGDGGNRSGTYESTKIKKKIVEIERLKPTFRLHTRFFLTVCENAACLQKLATF